MGPLTYLSMAYTTVETVQQNRLLGLQYDELHRELIAAHATVAELQGQVAVLQAEVDSGNAGGLYKAEIREIYNRMLADDVLMRYYCPIAAEICLLPVRVVQGEHTFYFERDQIIHYYLSRTDRGLPFTNPTTGEVINLSFGDLNAVDEIARVAIATRRRDIVLGVVAPTI